MKKLLIIFYLISNTALAARLEDVRILNTNPGKENIELKLQAANSPNDSYFFVDIVKSDEESFKKLLLVIKKIEKGEKFKLSLEIPSFSPAPSGSYYRSQIVTFFGASGGE